jgi:hypothetical protein
MPSSNTPAVTIAVHTSNHSKYRSVVDSRAVRIALLSAEALDPIEIRQRRYRWWIGAMLILLLVALVLRIIGDLRN